MRSYRQLAGFGNALIELGRMAQYLERIAAALEEIAKQLRIQNGNG